jgi:hypothetical protein
MDTAIPPREETGSQISARLLEVIAHAEFEVLPELYAFGPLSEGVTPRKDALACVRDGGAWSQLVPVDDGATPTAFRIFSFRRLVLGLLLVSGCVLVGSSLVG